MESLRGPGVVPPQSCRTCLPEHLWEVIHVGGSQGLGLEALGLKQILGDIRSVDQHPVLGSLFVAKGVKQDLGQEERETVREAHLREPCSCPIYFYPVLDRNTGGGSKACHAK